MTTLTSTTAIAIDSATRTFGQGDAAVHALRGVTLEIPAGEFVVLLGPSGSGKTTLLNIVGGIDAPTSGNVVVADSDLSDLSDAERCDYRRNHVGFVFQFYNLIPTLTVHENVQLVADLAGDGGAERATEALRAVGLGERLNAYPAEMSGGQQQRVAIARAIAKQPPIMLADEPTGALDLETGRDILQLLHRLNRTEGHTVLLVTHNTVLSTMADRVVRLQDGQIADVTVNDSPVEPRELSW